MWRSFLSSNLKQTVSSLIQTTHHGFRTETGVHCCFRRAGLREFSVQTPPPPPTPPPPVTPSKNTKEKDGGSTSGEEQQPISFVEAKKLMRLVNVEALKKKLGMEKGEVIAYCDLIQACQSMGVARTADEAAAFVQVLDQAGVVLIFRDKVYLHPDKVVDLVRRAVPLALAPDDDPRKDELKKLQMKKEEIDKLAHKQVRQILWAGLGFSVLQVGLFFRLTFWEFSWDVMEPVAFFTTTTGLVVGYAYFLFTSRDPTYQDLMKRIFLSRRRKLFKSRNFDIERFVELEKQCKSPLDQAHSDMELEADIFQGGRPPSV